MPLLTLHDFEVGALDTLLDYARIPCLSPSFDADWPTSGHLDHAIDLLAQWARERSLKDFDVTIHRLDGRTPLLCITVEATSASSGTALLYGHLDKQPPLGAWSEGLGPYDPVRRGDRVYARGVADDGYSLFAALLAIEAMEASDIGHSRCVVLIEASEESGSPDLDAYLDHLGDHLGHVELLVCLDAGGLTYDRLWLTTSLRGIVNVEVTVHVLDHGLHSGSVSGVVPSSFRLLRQLLDRVEDVVDGRNPHRGTALHDSARVRAAAEDVAGEFGDVVGEPVEPGRRDRADGLLGVGTNAARHVVSDAVRRGHRRRARARHRGQRPASFHDGGPLVSTTAERGRDEGRRRDREDAAHRHGRVDRRYGPAGGRRMAEPPSRPVASPGAR